MKHWLILGLLIILSSSAYAQISTNDVAKKCSCDLYRNKYTITNDADVTLTYTIENFGSGAYLAKGNTKKVQIPAGQSFDYLNIYNSNCEVYGNYEIITIFSDNSGRKQTIKKNLEISQCKNLEAQASGANEACVGEEIKFSVEVTNTRYFEDELKFSVSGYDDYSLNNEYMDLPQGETKTFEVSFFSNEPSTYYPQIIIESLISGQKISVPVELYYQNCMVYDFEIVGNKEYCGMGEYELIVTNSGTRDLVLPITSNIGSVSGNITVSSNGQEKLGFDVNVDAGKYMLGISVGDKEKKIEINKKSEYECYQLDLEKDYFMVNNETESISIVLVSNGIESSDYTMKSNFGEWYFSMIPGEKRYFEVPIGKHLVGEYTYTLEIMNDEGISFDKAITLQVKESTDTNWVLAAIIIVILVVIIYISNKMDKK